MKLENRFYKDLWPNVVVIFFNFYVVLPDIKREREKNIQIVKNISMSSGFAFEFSPWKLYKSKWISNVIPLLLWKKCPNIFRREEIFINFTVKYIWTVLTTWRSENIFLNTTCIINISRYFKLLFLKCWRNQDPVIELSFQNISRTPLSFLRLRKYELLKTFIYD